MPLIVPIVPIVPLGHAEAADKLVTAGTSRAVGRLEQTARDIARSIVPDPSTQR